MKYDWRFYNFNNSKSNVDPNLCWHKHNYRKQYRLQENSHHAHVIIEWWWSCCQNCNSQGKYQVIESSNKMSLIAFLQHALLSCHSTEALHRIPDLTFQISAFKAVIKAGGGMKMKSAKNRNTNWRSVTAERLRSVQVMLPLQLSSPCSFSLYSRRRVTGILARAVMVWTFVFSRYAAINRGNKAIATVTAIASGWVIMGAQPWGTTAVRCRI